MEPAATAVYDANILYPAPLRDLFIRLAQAGLIRARWTEMIHDEWLRNVLEDNPQLSPERLARTRALMNEAVRECLVTGYEDLIEALTLPDPDDRHVLAAAIRAEAGIIVTYNLADFPADTLARFDIEAQHPDDFLVSLLDAAPGEVCAAVKRQRESLRNPPKTAEELLTTFEGQGLTQAVARLRPECSRRRRQGPAETDGPQGDAAGREGNLRKGGRVALVNRGYLVSAGEHDPVSLGGIRVAGSWRFAPDPRAKGNARVDILSVMTRADARVGEPDCEVHRGVEFRLLSNELRSAGRGGGSSAWARASGPPPREAGRPRMSSCSPAASCAPSTRERPGRRGTPAS